MLLHGRRSVRDMVGELYYFAAAWLVMSNVELETSHVREQLFVGETKKNVLIFMFFNFLKQVLCLQKSMTQHWNG